MDELIEKVVVYGGFSALFLGLIVYIGICWYGGRCSCAHEEMVV